MNDDALRVSDADRERAVVSLREHLLAGRLTLAEFSERAGAALQARVGADLARAQHDLPPAPAQAALPRRRPARLTGVVFGHVARRGRLRLRRWSVATVAFGDLDLDLREATFERSRTAVTVLAFFGNADLYLPEGIDVEVSGMTVLGHRRDWGKDEAPADAPAIRVRVLGCGATVDVWRVPQDMRGSYSDIFRKLKKRQRQLPR